MYLVLLLLLLLKILVDTFWHIDLLYSVLRKTYHHRKNYLITSI